MTVVYEWMCNRTIVSAMTLELKNCKPIKIKDLGNNMSIPKVTGKSESKNRRLNTFFRVRINKNIRELTNKINGILKEGDAKVLKEFILPEHVKKLGYICGPYVKFANIEYCEKALAMMIE